MCFVAFIKLIDWLIRKRTCDAQYGDMVLSFYKAIVRDTRVNFSICNQMKYEIERFLSICMNIWGNIILQHTTKFRIKEPSINWTSHTVSRNVSEQTTKLSQQHSEFSLYQQRKNKQVIYWQFFYIRVLCV